MAMKAETPRLKKAKMVASILNVVGGLLVQERKIIKNENDVGMAIFFCTRVVHQQLRGIATKATSYLYCTYSRHA